MKVITLPIGKGRNQLCALVPKIKAGAQVILTSRGEPKIIITAYRPAQKRRRVAEPTPDSHFWDIQSLILENW